jgi:hypothetical protein
VVVAIGTDRVEEKPAVRVPQARVIFTELLREELD